MKPLSFLISVLFFQQMVSAQGRWIMGLEFNPAIYWYLNATDEEGASREPDLVHIIYPNSFSPTSYAAGFNMLYESESWWNVQTGLNYSTNLSKYKYGYKNPISPGGSTFESRLGYVNMPILVGCKYSPGFNENYFYFNLGPNISFLTNYADIKTVNITGINHISQSKIINNTLYVIDTKDGEVSKVNFKSDWKYRRLVLGVVAEAGIRFRLSKSLSAQIAIRADTSISHLDNLDAKNYPYLEKYFWNNNRSGAWGGVFDQPRSKSYNVRAGLNLGLYYQWDRYR